MMRITKEIRAYEILNNYRGTNDFIIKLKEKNKNSNITLNENQIDFIINFHNTKPLVLNKEIELHPFVSFRMKEKYKLSYTPNTIFIEKVFGFDKEKVYVWGRFEHGKFNSLIPITVNASINENEIYDINWNKFKRKPYEHQKLAVNFLMRKDKAILADDMGLAKTSSSIIAAMEKKFKKILIICPASVKINWEKEIKILDTKAKVSIVYGSNWEVGQWTIVNYDILKNFHHKPQRGVKKEELPISTIDYEQFDAVIIDECFPYNTLVDTDKGKIKIGDIVENTLDVKIRSYNLEENIFEYKEIDRWIKKENDTILRIKTQNGVFIECTPNHKIYVNGKGYIRADKLKKNDQLFTLPEAINKETDIKKREILFKKLYHESKWEEKQQNNKKMEVFGQKKNRSFKLSGVDSIEILESGSGESNRKMYHGDQSVYNIEVRDNHNYIADGILVSNCHYLKNEQTSRSKLVMDFIENIKVRWLLTGTPITNKPIDYYNLLKMIDHPIADNWVYFIERYCKGKRKKKKGGGQYWFTGGASNLDELYKFTHEAILRRRREDAIDLPEKQIQPVYLSNTNAQMYNDYINEYKEWVKSELENDNEPHITQHLAHLVKVKQFLANDKINTTIELAEKAIENGKKVVIFTCFTETLRSFLKHFGEKQCVYIDGSVSATGRQKAIDSFQKNKKINVFVGNIIAAGIGITLTEGEVMIFNDLDWVPANHAQAEDRIHRIGLKNNVLIYYPLIDETFDIDMFEKLIEKKKVINKILGEEDNAMKETLAKYLIQKMYKEINN